MERVKKGSGVVSVIDATTIIVYSLLAAVILVGALVSLSLKPQIRGWRNLTMLGCYVVGIVSFFLVDFFLAVGVWVGLGVLVGIAYVLYECWMARRHPDPEAPSGIQLSHVVFGPLAWPLMLLEVVEYTWGEFFPTRLEPPAAESSDSRSLPDAT